LERFVRGDIVVVPFPFSDLSKAKRRPAFVIKNLEGDDLILCQITSQRIRDSYSIEVVEADFELGSLKQTSNVRPNRIFTADQGIVLYQIGHLKPSKTEEIIERICTIIRE
jgi:mRNA interferase MazF